MAINNGGPAFPMTYAIREWVDNNVPPGRVDGMSMRDWFAGMAMQGLAADATVAPPDGQTYEGFIAELSCKLADAMLAERDKT